MAATVARGSNNRIGTCPHGLPMGACPICNGMGGGGGSVKKTPSQEKCPTTNVTLSGK